MRHLMSPLDFSVEELDELLNLHRISRHIRTNMPMPATGRKLATLFYEPSTTYQTEPRGGHAEPWRKHHGLLLRRFKFGRKG